jgi:hypothetical protein
MHIREGERRDILASILGIIAEVSMDRHILLQKSGDPGCCCDRTLTIRICDRLRFSFALSSREGKLGGGGRDILRHVS